MYSLSLSTTRNKLNNYHNYEQKSQYHQQLRTDLEEKHEKVRLFREKKENDMKEVREMLRKSREKERLVIRNNSLKFDAKIKKNKELEFQIKERMVKQIRKDKENFKESMVQSRIQE